MERREGRRTLELVNVESVDLGVRLGVLDEAEEELGRLDGPATLDDTEGLGLGGTATEEEEEEG